MSDTWWRFLAFLTFILVPIVICVLIAGARRKQFLDVITGNDGRLSLSRLQAVAWSVVIFGAYPAAMLIHPPIRTTSATEAKTIDDAVPLAEDAVKKYQQAFDEANVALVSKGLDADVAAGLLREASSSPAGATAELKKNREERIIKASENKKKADEEYKAAAAKVKGADASLKSAKEGRSNAISAWRQIHWVTLPAELLALAGISLAGGAFASIIAVSKSDQSSPTVAQVTAAATPALLPTVVLPGAAATNSAYWLDIAGQNLGTGGSVRVDGLPLNPLLWTPTQIATEISAGSYKTLTVDTPAGKVVYALTGTVAVGLALGPQQIQREWADLFRDDTNPHVLSVTKCQLFGWTVVAIGVYVVLLLQALWTLHVDSLPLIDSSIVTLTGVSLASYVTGKAISQPPKA